jgi:hypothetical protein
MERFETGIMSEAADERRMLAIQEFEQVLRDIRSVLKLSQFQFGHIISEMQSCITQQCTVVVNIAKARSNAIIVTAESVKLIPLQKLQANDLQARLSQQWNGQISTEEKGHQNCRKLLSWLWKNSVEDIMNVMRKTTNKLTPRICWVRCGLASALPFRAAGSLDNPGQSVMNMAISFYAPSFIAALNLDRGKIAYLSACSTAENKWVKIADEKSDRGMRLPNRGIPARYWLSVELERRVL